MQPSQASDFRANILACGEGLKRAVDTLRTGPEHWHTTLLIELAGENLINALEVVTGEQQQNACRCAWAARNLLELHYFTRFVIQSPENAQRFHDDMLCDFQDMLEVTAKHPQWASYGVAAQATIDEVWQKPGVNAKRAMRTSMHAPSRGHLAKRSSTVQPTSCCRNLCIRQRYQSR